MKMINLWVFNMYLEKEIEKKIESLQEEKDPYNKMVLDAEKRLLENIFNEYKNLIINQ